jgi:hypothetical protein
MAIYFDFKYELPSGQEVYVESMITPPDPGKEGPNYSNDEAYPAEGGYAEISSTYLIDGHSDVYVLADLDNLWVRTKQRDAQATYVFTNYLDDLQEVAYDKWYDSIN